MGAFIASLESNVKEIYDKFFKFPKKMIRTDVEKEKFDAATNCHICGENFKDKSNSYHAYVPRKINYFGSKCKYMLCIGNITVEFRGAAHSLCNLWYQIPGFIPVVYHNLSGYDSNLFVKILADKNGKNIGYIPVNEEKYISISRLVIVKEYEKKEKIRIRCRT